VHGLLRKPLGADADASVSQVSLAESGPNNLVELTAHSARCFQRTPLYLVGRSSPGAFASGGRSDETGHCLDEWAS
jgi:hypothetical protein